MKISQFPSGGAALPTDLIPIVRNQADFTVPANSLGVLQSVLLNNPTTANIAGQVSGLKIGVAAGTEASWTLNPAAANWVALYPYISSSAVRDHIWSFNPITDVISGFPATTWCMEGNINQNNANSPDPHQTNHAIGIDMVSGGTFAPSAAFSTLSTTDANRWKHGMWLENIGGQSGSSLIKTAATHVSVDFGIDFSSATINVQGIRIGNTTVGQVAGVAVRQFADNLTGLFLQRFTDSAPTGNLLAAVNAANNAFVAKIDASGNFTSAGSYTGVNVILSGVAGSPYTAVINAPNSAGLSNGLYVKAGTNTSDFTFAFQNASGVNLFTMNGAGQVAISAPVSGTPLSITAGGAGSSALSIISSVTTGAQTATFTATNKPGSGTTAPTKWLPIVCDGVTYYIPLWPA